MPSGKDWTRDTLEKHYVGKMKAITIPIDIALEGRQKIIDLGQMEELLRGAGRISLSDCDCRRMMGNCIEPMSGCLGLDEEADRAIREEGAVEVTVEQALSALRETYEAGLVHMAYVDSGDEKPTKVCSCCRCCCHSLSAALRFGYHDHVLYSDRIAHQDVALCENCGSCVERCHFSAREMVEGALRFDAGKCAGCGSCLMVCPAGAISMAPREKD
jgi:ferredoxin